MQKTGEPGKEQEIILELKILADVGLLGFPNAGKSTFLSTVTDARPKIANYQFTTLEPNLGVIKSKNGTSFVIADIPGIIEGASKGVGLGLQFLRHIERTRLLLHLIDISGLEGRNPVDDFNIINKELKEYSEKLANKMQIIVATKSDIENQELYNQLEKLALEKNIKIFKISSVTGKGLEELLDYVSKILPTLPKEELYDIKDKVIYELDDEENKIEIIRTNNVFEVKGQKIEKIIRRVNISDNESMYYLHKNLVNLGIEAELKKKGIKEGDIVKISNYEFEWYE